MSKERRFNAIRSLRRIVAVTFIVAATAIPLAVQAEPVSLLIWVEDAQIIPILPTQSLPRSQYEVALGLYKKLNITPIKSVFIKNGQVDELETHLDSVLLPSDTIENLILATHGETNTTENKTELSRLGGFSTDGSFGNMRQLLKHLAPHFGNKLHISLNACSTACGTRSQFESRVSGLANELSVYGVEQLSVWGTTQSMVFDDNHQPLESPGVRKRMIKPGMIGAAVLGISMGAIALLDQSSSLGFATSLGAFWGTLGAGATYGAIRLYARTVASAGLLTISKDGHAQTIDLNAGTFDSLQPTQQTCDLLLEGTKDTSGGKE